VDQLLAFNGWVAAACPTLLRPFTQSKHLRSSRTHDLLSERRELYYIALIISSADHFLIDQFAVIVQLARQLGSDRVYVSMVDYASTDSTPSLLDLFEAALTLLGIPFRIRHIPPMTEERTFAYYPLEEAHMRNVALEPLMELKERRRITFGRVIWLKGFTCPNDVFEAVRISWENDAEMVCGMDWRQSQAPAESEDSPAVEKERTQRNEKKDDFVFSDLYVLPEHRSRDAF
jgi:hypothetical protein